MMMVLNYSSIRQSRWAPPPFLMQLHSGGGGCVGMLFLVILKGDGQQDSCYGGRLVDSTVRFNTGNTVASLFFR